MNIDRHSGIAYRRWMAHSTRGAFILIHGLGAHTGRWSAMARHLSQNNFSVYALELRGFGKTRGIPGYVDSFKTYLNDITRLREIVQARDPGKPVFILGESMGALAVFLTVAERPSDYRGAVLMSPAFTSRLKFTALGYLDMFISFFMNPTKAFRMPFNSAMCTRDAQYQRILDRDRRERRVATAKLLSAIAGMQIRSRLAAFKVKTPILFLIAGADELVDPDVSKAIFRTIKQADKRIIEYPDMKHSLSIDLGKEKVFTDIAGWAKQRCA